MRLLLPDEQTTFHYASLFASLVIQHGLILLTRDAHFVHVPKLLQMYGEKMRRRSKGLRAPFNFRVHRDFPLN